MVVRRRQPVSKYAKPHRAPLVPLGWNEKTLEYLDHVVRGEFTMRQSFGDSFFVYHTPKGFGISFNRSSPTYAILEIRFKDSELKLRGPNPGANPIVADALVLLNLMDELRDLRITTSDDSLDPMTVREAVKQLNVLAHEALTRPKTRVDDRRVTGRYRYRVLKQLGDDDWFHVTRASALPSIMRTGLIPSETMRSLQGERGWTEWNLHLQNVVYLTADQDYAAAIAETLAGRFEEDAIVLEVHCPIDPKTVRFDEDALRDDWGTLHLPDRSSTPDFIHSFAGKNRSIGVARRIAAKCVKLVARLTAPVYEVDEERDTAYLVGGLEWIEYE